MQNEPHECPHCGHRDAARPDPVDGVTPTARDPVCGMSVDPATAKHRHHHAGVDYYFCALRCKERFQADPNRFLAPKAQQDEAEADGAIYTCPMHPEVRQVGPGTCPKCGMALEPELISADAAPNAELTDMTRRFWIGLVLALPVVVLEMGGHLSGGGGNIFGLESWTVRWLSLVLATPVVLWAGWPFLVRGWQSVVSRNLNMFTLIGAGTFIAWAYSVAATLWPGAFPPAAGTPGSAEPAVYFESAAVITVLVLLGQVLELKARERTGGAIRALLRLAPDTARRLRNDGQEEDVSLDVIAVGDRLRVRPGERVPVDGTVVEGASAIDESMVTGEPMPVARGPNDAVIGGTMNGEGSFVMSAAKVGADTLLSRIVHMVAEAQRSRAPIQSMADKVSAWFVPAVLGVAAIAFLAWIFVGPEPRLAYALVAAISALIIACPCALGLATPMSIMVGLGRGARAGVLIRDAAALERLSEVDTLLIDKTGTLTEGRPAVTMVRSLGPLAEDDLLRLAASVERASEHPLAAALAAEARRRNLKLAPISDFRATPGRGVSGRAAGKVVVVGNAAMLSEAGLDARALDGEAEPLRRDGASVFLIAVDGTPAGLVAVSDPIKPAAADALAALRDAGLRVVMLSGDNEASAKAVARRLGITEVEAGASPADKARAVKRLKGAGRVVAMAGDGINDAPALAAADVGIAMGTGTDVAIESAGVTLLKGDISGLVRARRLSQATLRNIRQNLFLAFAYNAAGVPIAAGALYPWTGTLLSPMIAAAAMSLSSVSVITNALRLNRARL